MRTKILNNNVWVHGSPSEGEWHQKEVTEGVWQEERYFTKPKKPNPISLIIEGDKTNNVMQLGETLSFTVTFSDLTINASIPVSIVNRENSHVANAFVVIVNGIGTGTFTPTKAIDYFVTEQAINYHSDSLGVPLKLTTPFFLRVVQ